MGDAACTPAASQIDLEVELKTHALVEATGETEFTLPARKLMDICKALPDGAQLTIETDGDKAVLRSGRGRYSLGMLPAQDYPSIEPSKASEKFSLRGGVMKRLIEKTQFAMAQQDVRYYLNGLLLEIRPGRVRAVATDGHRLALCDAGFDDRSYLRFARLGWQTRGLRAALLPFGEHTRSPCLRDNRPPAALSGKPTEYRR